MQHPKPGLVPGFVFYGDRGAHVNARGVLPHAVVTVHADDAIFIDQQEFLFVEVVTRAVATYTRSDSTKCLGDEMRAMTMILLAALAAPGLAQAMDCSATRVQQPLRPTVIAPVASELAMATSQLGAPGGVLSQAFDESQSLDQVLLRIRIESCRNVATTTPAPSVVSPDDPAAYKPRTEFDNTPWRFNMSQNGKKMTADEFSAWMKSRGVRVARGAAAVAPAAVPAVDATGAVPAPGATTGMPPGALPESAPVPAATSPGTVSPPTEPVAPAKPR